jgi:3',5'-cyclic AMP phosphodiesterase CpdA
MMTRLAILADVHLGTRETQFPGQDLTYAADLLRRAATLIQPQKPREVVIVGDLVNMGTAAEYELAREGLRGLADVTTTVPGNHELVKASLEDFRARSIGPRTTDLRASGNGPYVAWINSGIEGLTPWHWHGAVDEPGLRILDRATSEHGNQPLIVFCHHPPEDTVRPARYPMMFLTNSDDVMTRLMKHPSPVVMFCGHTHVPDVFRRRNLTVITVPPLCFWPHAFLIVELRAGLMHVTTHRVVESPHESPDAKINEPGYLDERESWVPQITIRLGLPERNE